MFALLSRRENQAAVTLSNGSLRVRRAWTLLDRAYAQCRRALEFLRFEDDDADSLAPSLRRNQGPRLTTNTPAPNPVPAPSSGSNGSSGTVTEPTVAASIGGGSGPFMAKS
jgi:hypothetical protein